MPKVLADNPCIFAPLRPVHSLVTCTLQSISETKVMSCSESAGTVQGRTGGSLPSWLLPTPTPEAADKKSGPQISPLNLRTKYIGAC